MSEPEGNDADVYSRLEQMDGGCVSDQVGCDILFFQKRKLSFSHLLGYPKPVFHPVAGHRLALGRLNRPSTVERLLA
jgi:hypothetical protein